MLDHRFKGLCGGSKLRILFCKFADYICEIVFLEWDDRPVFWKCQLVFIIVIDE